MHSVFEDNELFTGWRLKFSQLKGLLKKKIILTHRHWILLVFQLLTPTLPIIILVILSKMFKAPPAKSSHEKSKNWTDVNGLSKPERFYSKDSVSHLRHVYDDLVKSKGLLAMTSDVYDNNLRTMESIHNSPYLIGASISPDHLVAYYNNKFYPTASLALNMLHQAIIM